MLPCARSCIGKKLNRLPAVCADSQPIEPLLFLYPRWFREKARQSSHTYRIQARNTSSAPKSRNSLSAATSKDDGLDLHFQPPNHEISINTIPDGVSNLNRGSHHGRSALPLPPPSSYPAQRWRPFDEAERGRKQEEDPQGSSLDPQVLEFSQDINSVEIARLLPGRQYGVPHDSSTISLRVSFLEWLTGTSEENIWKHHDGSGCTVHVTTATQKNTGYRRVLLIGTVRAREITSQHLKHLQQTYLEHKIEKTVVESVHVEANTGVQNIYRRVDHLPKPQAWNFKTFARYVDTITTTCAPKAVNRILYPTKLESFHASVGKILVEIFSAPQLRRFQTSSALRRALEFCSRLTEMSHVSNQIWIGANKAGIVPDIACFNLEIDRCIKIREAGAIRRVIAEMEESHIRPNGATLGCLFNLLNTKEEQRSFLQLPNIQHTVNDLLTREMLVAAFVRTEFEPSDNNRNVVNVFHRKMQKYFGKSWLSPLVARTMLLKCSRAAAYYTISQVLRLVTNLSVKLDSESFLVLFKAVQKTGWFEDMLLLLHTTPSRLTPVTNQFEIEIAFREAWRQRLVNTCRVLWHYAASHGSIRYMMMMKVAKELPYNVDSGKNMHLTALMAKIIVGADYASHSIKLDNVLKEVHDVAFENAAKLSQYTADGEDRHNQLQFSHFLIEREMTAWQRIEPMAYETMLELIDKAYNLDISWLQEGLVSKSSTLDWIGRAIQIDLKPRTEPVDLSQVVETTNWLADEDSSLSQENRIPDDDTVAKIADIPPGLQNDRVGNAIKI